MNLRILFNCKIDDSFCRINIVNFRVINLKLRFNCCYYCWIDNDSSLKNEVRDYYFVKFVIHWNDWKGTHDLCCNWWSEADLDGHMMIWTTLFKNKIKSLNTVGFAFLKFFFDCLKFIWLNLFKDDHMMTFYCLY